MNLSIRKAKFNDINEINRIAKQIHNLHVEIRPDLYKYNEIIISKDRFQELLNDGIIFVGEIDKKIVSYAICFLKQIDNPLMINKKVFFIDAFGNDICFHGRGIGKNMMSFLCSYAKNIGCERLELQVNAKNKNAIGFYEHFGMKEKSKTLELDLY